MGWVRSTVDPGNQFTDCKLHNRRFIKGDRAGSDRQCRCINICNSYRITLTIRLLILILIANGFQVGCIHHIIGIAKCLVPLQLLFSVLLQFLPPFESLESSKGYAMTKERSVAGRWLRNRSHAHLVAWILSDAFLGDEK